MEASAAQSILEQSAVTQSALLDLNNAHAHQTSRLTPTDWQELLGQAFAALCIDAPGSLLIALDQDADYGSPNFRWLGNRFARFVYVDRIVVAQSHQRKGLATRLYEELFRRAIAADHKRVVCEVNVDPPNPGSGAFHMRMGFDELGRAKLPGGSRTVKYLVRRL